MLKRRTITIVLLVIFLCLCFTENVFASKFGNIAGFGNYDIGIGSGGEIVVNVTIDRANATTDQAALRTSFDSLFVQYGKTITWCTGIATITLIVVFIWLCIKSAFMASEHWIIKRQTMTAMLWVGVGTALMGSATLILLIFQNAFV